MENISMSFTTTTAKQETQNSKDHWEEGWHNSREQAEITNKVGELSDGDDDEKRD